MASKLPATILSFRGSAPGLYLPAASAAKLAALLSSIKPTSAAQESALAEIIAVAQAPALAEITGVAGIADCHFDSIPQPCTDRAAQDAWETAQGPIIDDRAGDAPVRTCGMPPHVPSPIPPAPPRQPLMPGAQGSLRPASQSGVAHTPNGSKNSNGNRPKRR